MRYYVKTFYRYGRVSAVEDELMRFGEKKRQFVLSSEALDRFVQEIKDEQERVLKLHYGYKAVIVSLEKRLSQKTGLPVAAIRIGYHVIYLESVQGEE